MLYYIFLSIFLLIFTGLTGYLVYRFNKTFLIKLIKDRGISRILLLIIFLSSLLFLVNDTINTLIVIIHLFCYLLFFDLLIFILKKISKKHISNGISFILAILTTTIYLTYGYYLAHHVVETKYIIETKKDIGSNNFRLIQITDSHIGATMNGDDFIEYMEKINKLDPDIVVVTGDFVDDDTSLNDMIKGCIGLGKLKTKYGVYFTYGNHDKAYFNYRNFDDLRLRQELNKNNVVILEDEVELINDSIYLVGRQDRQVKNRMSAEKLTENLDKNKYIIGLDHRPDDYENEASANYDLVLSGHTHGGQMLPIGQVSVLLGINDSYYGKKVIDDTTFITSSGIGDWQIKFKTGTIAEYVVIDIKN